MAESMMPGPVIVLVAAKLLVRRHLPMRWLILKTLSGCLARSYSQLIRVSMVSACVFAASVVLLYVESSMDLFMGLHWVASTKTRI